MVKNRKSYFLHNFMKASGNSRAYDLKASCSFVFRCMLHFKTRCASLIFSSKTVQNCIILELFQIDPKRKNIRSKVDQISERVLRTIFLLVRDSLPRTLMSAVKPRLIYGRLAASARWLVLPCIGALMHPGIRCIVAAIERSVNFRRIEPSVLAEIEIPEKNEISVIMKSWKSYFLADSASASGNLVACNLKISCSFVFWSMLHLKQRLAESNFSLKTFQNWLILKLF